MQKLTRKTWFKTVKQDLAIIFRLLWEALKCFMMFEYAELWVNLVVAWMMLTAEVVREDEEQDRPG